MDITEYLDTLDKGLGASDAYVSVPMAADALGVEQTTVRAYIRTHKLRPMKIETKRGEEWSGVSARSLIREVKARQAKIAILVDPMTRDLIAVGGHRVEYGVFMSRNGLSSRNPNDRLLTAIALGEISKASIKSHGFMLSAQVVRKDNGLPSAPFFDLAIDEEVMQPSDDEEDFVRKQLRKIRRAAREGALA